MKECKYCGKKYKLSLTDRFARNTVEKLSGHIIGLKEATKEAKNYCNKCWHDVVDPIAKNPKINK